MAGKYIFRVSAGPGYDEAGHVEVPVNRPEPVRITSDRAIIDLNVRVRGYNGLPKSSAHMSPYFLTEPHVYNQDQYSIALRFTPLRPPPPSSSASASSSSSSQSSSSQNLNQARGISAADLLFGNDFDRPIRDRLPPGVNTAMSIVKWWLDPGLQGDVYADKPYIYGPALSSFNVVSVGGGQYDEERGGLWIAEGGDKAGLEFRRAAGAPADNKARMKWALRQSSKESWVWEYDKTYGLDFYNPYLDFTNMALRLPGFQLPALKYLERHKPGTALRRSHHLRYVLRHRTTGEVYLAVVFSLVLREDVDKDGVWREKGIDSDGLDTGAEPANGVDVDVEENDAALEIEEEIIGDAGLTEAMKKLEAKDEESGPSTEATKDNEAKDAETDSITEAMKKLEAKDEEQETSIADVD